MVSTECFTLPQLYNRKSETLTSDVQHTITDISFIKSTNLVLGDIFITKYLDETFNSSAQNKK